MDQTLGETSIGPRSKAKTSLTAASQGRWKPIRLGSENFIRLGSENFLWPFETVVPC